MTPAAPTVTNGTRVIATAKPPDIEIFDWVGDPEFSWDTELICFQLTFFASKISVAPPNNIGIEFASFAHHFSCPLSPESQVRI